MIYYNQEQSLQITSIGVLHIIRPSSTNGLTKFRELYLQNYSYEKFETLTRSVFKSQLQKGLNEPFPKKSSFEDIIVGSWSILTENTQVTSYFHYIFKTRFFWKRFI